MAKRISRIRTKSVRVSLGRVVSQLRELRRSDPEEFKALANRVPKGAFRTTDAWFAHLEVTLKSIPEWCPNPRGDNQFTIDVPPSSRRRRT